MDLSVVIVGWNTRGFLEPCLHSLASSAGSLKSEVWVVDNASTDGSAQLVRERFPAVRLIENAENRGFAAANNQALRRCSGRYVMFLNPDTVAAPGVLQSMVRYLDERRDVGGAAPKLLNPDKTLQYSLRRFPTALTPFTENSSLHRLPFIRAFADRYRLKQWSHDDVAVIDQPMGAAIMLRREVLQEIGPLDEAFHMFFEDVDLCYRIKAAGWPLHYLPHCQIIHYGGRSVIQREEVRNDFYRSLLFFFRKHHGLLQVAVARGSIFACSVIDLSVICYKVLALRGRARERIKQALELMALSLSSIDRNCRSAT